MKLFLPFSFVLNSTRYLHWYVRAQFSVKHSGCNECLARAQSLLTKHSVLNEVQMA